MELSGDGSVLAVLAPIKVADNYLYSYKYDHNTSTVALYTFRRDAESFNNEWKPMTDTATLFHKLDAMFPGIYAPNDPLAVSFDGNRLAMAWLVEAERTENNCDEREFRVMVMDYNETSRAWKIVAEKTSVDSNIRNYAYAYNLYSHLSVSITPNGETIAVGNSGGSRRKCNEEKGLEGSVTVYDVRGNHLLPNGTIDGRNAGDQLGFSVALGPNGDTLAILQRTEDNSIHFFGYRGEQMGPHF